MDNKGGSSGEKAVPTSEAPGFDEFLQNREMPQPQGEVPAPEVLNQTAEVASEQMSDAMPAATPAMPAKEESAQETPALTELKTIGITRDAESLPKEYVAAIAKIINSDKLDPHKLVSDLDKARWDMLEKAYGRKLGDGLNGSGGNGRVS